MTVSHFATHLAAIPVAGRSLVRAVFLQGSDDDGFSAVSNGADVLLRGRVREISPAFVHAVAVNVNSAGLGRWDGELYFWGGGGEADVRLEDPVFRRAVRLADAIPSEGSKKGPFVSISIPIPKSN